MEQKYITADNGFAALEQWVRDTGACAVFLVCDDSVKFLPRLTEKLDELEKAGFRFVRFSDFRPNPLYESVAQGVKLFNENGCGAIMAVGGGSAIDVAKCVKLYRNMDHSRNYLEQKIEPDSLPFLAMPTTAGTGSEATRYAVIYYGGEKQSVTSEYAIPQTVLFDAGALATLPVYQKKSTAMDALCHAIESFWSVNSTEESRSYSRDAIKLILDNLDGYLNSDVKCCAAMLRAANTSGKAINITQTTAGHAMCYKLTSLYGIAHGHAAILCVRKLYPYMARNLDKCTDKRGEDYLAGVMLEIARAMGRETVEQGAARLEEIFASLGLDVPVASENDIEVLTGTVNPVRLGNNPVRLDADAIRTLYREILR